MRRLRNITQKKEWDQFTTGNVKETAISNMSGRKIKVMIIKILTGLERRVVYISEILNKDKKEPIRCRTQ